MTTTPARAGVAEVVRVAVRRSQALRKAQVYLQTQAFSRSSLIDQLTSEVEGFTQMQAEYAADQAGLEPAAALGGFPTRAGAVGSPHGHQHRGQREEVGGVRRPHGRRSPFCSCGCWRWPAT